jgi:phospholipid transport system transporter-binding protein
VSTARIEALGAGRFRVSGVLNAATVTDLLKQSRESFAGAKHIEMDLGGVSEGDSAGLALLLEWLRMTRQANQQIGYANVPAQINALARISEVDDLLAANGAGASPTEVPQPAGQQGSVTPKTQTA